MDWIMTLSILANGLLFGWLIRGRHERNKRLLRIQEAKRAEDMKNSGILDLRGMR